ncbi:MAG: Holliday junction resolvase RuvX [Flavobacteriales bacterium]|jgi:putative Holliday junction resolvase|nr:Holliday junction resolvase RuvX [Flavobacteriales bacterium]MCI1754182.1 Holliday junction resolvase RuvX [Flavobacteriales bacterium]
MRILAIDFGLKRTGLAVTDPARIIASALDTVPSAELMDYLKRYVAKEAVEGFVVGMPCNLDGTPTDITANVRLFMTELKRQFPRQWVETADERFTSVIAQRTMLASGIGKKARREKGTVDRISAVLILQGWMDRSRGR